MSTCVGKSRVTTRVRVRCDGGFVHVPSSIRTPTLQAISKHDHKDHNQILEPKCQEWFLIGNIIDWFIRCHRLTRNTIASERRCKLVVDKMRFCRRRHLLELFIPIHLAHLSISEFSERCQFSNGIIYLSPNLLSREWMFRFSSFYISMWMRNAEFSSSTLSLFLLETKWNCRRRQRRTDGGHWRGVVGSECMSMNLHALGWMMLHAERERERDRGLWWLLKRYEMRRTTEWIFLVTGIIYLLSEACAWWILLRTSHVQFLAGIFSKKQRPFYDLSTTL